MSAVVIDVIEKGTIARSFLKQMGISNFFDGSLTEVAINRPGEIWTKGGGEWRRHDAPACSLDACFKLANALTVMKGGNFLDKGADSSGRPARWTARARADAAGLRAGHYLDHHPYPVECALYG